MKLLLPILLQDLLDLRLGKPPQTMLLHEYQAQWPQDFALLEAELSQALGGLPTSLEHVGSTAVPLLAAKPIIDIDIVVPLSVAFDLVKERLARIGYVHRGNQGIEGREVFKRATVSGATSGVLDRIAHHLYVCPADSPELHRHLAFRDYLRAQPATRMAYQQLKYQIAEAANHDHKRYATLKETLARDFVLDILAKATR